MRRAALLGSPVHFARYTGGGMLDPGRETGLKRAFNLERAIRQWRSLAETLTRLGLDVLVIDADKKLPGLALAGDHARAVDLEDRSGRRRSVHLRSTLAPPRAGEHVQVERVLRGVGLTPLSFAERFCVTDLHRCGQRWILTHGATDVSKVVAQLGRTPLRRVYGFGSDITLRERLSQLLGGARVQELELLDPAFPLGVMAMCPFGPDRRFLLVHLEAFSESSRQLILSNRLAEHVIPIDRHDAVRLAACSAQIEVDGDRPVLLCSEGLSDALLSRIESAGVEPCPVELDEFLKRGVGPRRLIADLGPLSEDDPRLDPGMREFRASLRLRG